MKRKISILAVLAAVYLVVSVAPVTAAHVALASSNTTASELSNGTLNNAEVARSGEAGVVSHEVSRSSAVARYTFDTGSGSTIYDSVGSNDATWGGSWVSTEHGSGVYLDDSSSAELGNLVDFGSENWTVSVRASYDGTSGTVWSSSDGDTDWESGQKRLDLTNDRVVFAAFGFPTMDVGGIDTTKTHTYTVSYNGSAARLYVDGELRVVQSGTIPSDNTGQPLRLGAGASTHFNGPVDEFRVYQESLSPGLVHRLSEYPVGKITPQANDRWAMDAGQGGVAYSDTGTRSATLDGATWTSGKSGPALQFNASSGDYAHVTNSGGWDQEVTLSVWIKPNQTTTEHTVVDSRTNGGVNLRVDNDQFEWVIRDDSGNEYFTAGGNPNPGEWTHVMAVYDGSSLVVYQDGNQVVSKQIGSITISSGGDLYIGNYAGLGTQYAWDGKIDELRMYNSALTGGHAGWLTDHPTASIEETSNYKGTHSVTNSVRGFTDLTLRNATATVTWSSGDGTVLNKTTFSSSGNHTLTWPTSSADNVDVDVDFNPSHPDHTARLSGEGVYAETNAPSVDDSSLSPNSTSSTVGSLPVTLSASVSDPDFGTSQGDSATVEWYVDGTKRGETTVSSNTTVSHELNNIDAGTHDWHVEITDDEGHTHTSATASFAMPGELRIYNESAPNSLVDSATVNIRFYGGEDGDAFTVQRSTTDGTIDMAGLPADQEFIVTAEHPDYYDRRVVLESLFEQQTIYLLNNTRAAADVIFVLQDRTDTFPQSETRLFIQKPINISNTTKFTTISGDSFGASGQYKATLATNGSNRYRLVVRNDDGDVRVLGAYTATVDEAVELEIGRLSYDLGQQGETFEYDAAYTESPQRVRFNYSDADTTEELTVVITNRTSGAEIVNKSFTDVSSLGVSEPISGNASERGYVVRFEGTRDGEAVSGQRIVGPRLGPGVNLDDTWRTRFGLAFMLVIGGAFGALRPEIGALAAGTIGGVLWFVGWLPAAVSGGVVVLAVAVAVLLGAKRGGL